MRALVTGGGGFLGRYVVELLRAEGHEVTSVGRGSYPELEALGARTLQVDLTDLHAVRDAFGGHDTVFHVAAKTGVWGPRAEYEAINVRGTENVIAASEQHRVKRLVYTSSPSVVFDGKSHVNAGPDLPYPARYLCAYPRTKARAERLVLEAHGRWGLSTVALRPHLIFGPRDPHLVPRLIERARAGKLAVVGDRTNEVTLCYVENAARAHLDAARTLGPAAAHGGRAYFIGQERPVLLWDWIDDLLGRVGLGPVRRRVSARTAVAAGAVLEAVWRLSGKDGEPPMTRFVARQLSTSHSYDMAPARRDFGYRERVSTEDGVARLVASLATAPPAQ